MSVMETGLGGYSRREGKGVVEVGQGYKRAAGCAVSIKRDDACSYGLRKKTQGTWSLRKSLLQREG